MEQKSKHPHWGLRFFLLYFLFIIIYIGYLYVFMEVRIYKTPDYQTEYGQYLIDSQDKMIEHSLEFASLTEDMGRVYTEKEKEVIEEELLEANNILKEVQKNAPDATNEDYIGVYNDILKIFSFYIQGEIMQAKYIYGYKENYIPEESFADETVREETYTMGISLCNMMGNMMLNNYKYINDVRGTSYESKYNIIPVGDLENYMSPDLTDEERQEILDAENVEAIEDLIHGKTPVATS